MSRLGDEIQRRRLARRWTMTTLAVYVGVVPATVGRWERGHAEPQARHCANLVEYLGFTYPELAELSRASDEGGKP